jgi:hypothetical protein
MESILLQHLVFFHCLLYFLLMMHFIFLSMINWLLMYLILSTMWPFLGPLQFEALSLYLPSINTTQQYRHYSAISFAHGGKLCSSPWVNGNEELWVLIILSLRQIHLPVHIHGRERALWRGVKQRQINAELFSVYFTSDPSNVNRI